MSKFRTVEESDERFETCNLKFMTVKTPNLQGRGDICVYVPPGIQAGQTIPIVLLLHGVYGSAWCWPYKAGIHLQANDMIEREEIPPMIIAMPSDGLWGDGSAYLPHNKCNFEEWIVKDVVNALVEKIAGATTASPLFIAGLSMGGFGALRIGAKYGNRFSGISGHSSITSLWQMKLFVEEDVENYYQFDQADEDVFFTFQRYQHHLPPVRFDCGTIDQLIDCNRNLHRQMQQENMPHVYEEYAGGHEWPYWERYIGESLRFFAKQLQ